MTQLLRLRNHLLGMASVAVLSASSYKAVQFTQNAWGEWEGIALITGAAVASFYALDIAFNSKAKKHARAWAAIAALVIAGLEGSAIMQGNIDKLAQQAQSTHTTAVSRWDAELRQIDIQHEKAAQYWEANKEKAETTRGENHKPLRDELRTLQSALTENAASQRSTKASDKDGNVTPAYQALLDQQAAMLQRSQAITDQLATPLQLDAKPSKPAYPARPVLAPVTLAPVEYAQAFAFPLLLLVIMFLRGRRDEENHAQASLADIRQQAASIAHYLNETVDAAEVRIHGLLTKADEMLELSLQAKVAAATRLHHELDAQAVHSGKVQADAIIALGEQTLSSTEKRIQLAIRGLLEEAGSATADLKKQIVQYSALLSKGTVPALYSTVPALYPTVPVQCTGTVVEKESNEGQVSKLTKNEALNLLRLQQIALNQNGLITVEMIAEHTGNGRKLAEKFRDVAIRHGYLLSSSHGVGIACTYPSSIQPDRHTQATSGNNIYVLTSRA